MDLDERPSPPSGQAIAPTRARYRTNHCVKNVKWRKEEDEHLMQIMQSAERPNYSQLAQLFPGKSGQQVAERWDKVLNPKLMKGSWTRQEDETIIAFVKANGTKKWQKLCELLPGRIGKQCRERWRNHLDPSINHEPWTPEEEALLEQKYREIGPRWAKIALAFEQRSDVNVKNHWTAMMNKQARERQMVEQQVPTEMPMYPYPYGHVVPVYTYYPPPVVTMPMPPTHVVHVFPVMAAPMPVPEVKVEAPPPAAPPMPEEKKEEPAPAPEPSFLKDDLWAHDGEGDGDFSLHFENAFDTSYDRFM